MIRALSCLIICSLLMISSVTKSAGADIALSAVGDTEVIGGEVLQVDFLIGFDTNFTENLLVGLGNVSTDDPNLEFTGFSVNSPAIATSEVGFNLAFFAPLPGVSIGDPPTTVATLEFLVNPIGLTGEEAEITLEFQGVFDTEFPQGLSPSTSLTVTQASSTIPEPESLALLAVMGVGFYSRRRKQSR